MRFDLNLILYLDLRSKLTYIILQIEIAFIKNNLSVAPTNRYIVQLQILVIASADFKNSFLLVG